MSNNRVFSMARLAARTIFSGQPSLDSDIIEHPGQCIHLAIDIQYEFYRSLSSGRFASFPASINAFAEDLRTINIPTLWVASGEDDTFSFVLPKRDCARLGLLDDMLALEKRLGLERIDRREDELLLIKGSDGAFDSEVLINYLHSNGIRTVIFSGMNTSSCILDSVKGAKAEGFRCIIAYDKLADTHSFRYNRAAERDPENHKLFLLTSPLLNTKKLLFLRAEEICQQFCSKLATASRQPARRGDLILNSTSRQPEI